MYLFYSRPRNLLPMRTPRAVNSSQMSTTAFNKRQSLAYKGLKKYSEELTILSADERFSGAFYVFNFDFNFFDFNMV